MVIVTHRGTNEIIMKKINDSKLIPYPTIVENEKRRKFEDKGPII